MPTSCSRLAPSPTGALHLGNARTFIWNWALARTRGWQLPMRIEDLDGPRIKPGAGPDALEALDWLGLDWDGDPLVQSENTAPYLDAMSSLAKAGRVYPCTLSRKDIASAASAPQETEHEHVFPASLRPPDAGTPLEFESIEGVHWRLIAPTGPTRVHDQISGEHESNLAQECGDFIVWTAREEPAYQLAVVVDDLRQGITDVVRGDDLLPSAARQQWVYEHLGATAPRWWHLPLVRGQDGRRLAKRHGDTRLDQYRREGVPPERVVGLLAYWCGLTPGRSPLAASGFLDLFDSEALPREDVLFSVEDESWLQC